MKICLLVEGSFAAPRPRQEDPLSALWKTLVPQALNLKVAIDELVPISKKNLLAMDDTLPRSGRAIPLDELILQRIKLTNIDAAIVVWDLIPQWADSPACRWQETLDLYRLLGMRSVLPNEWRDAAGARHLDLLARDAPSQRVAPPTLQNGSVVAICIDPMFETILVQDESAVRRALEVAGKNVPGWPTWARNSRRPDRELLAPAVARSRRVSTAAVFRRLGSDFKVAKQEWATYLYRKLCEDQNARNVLVSHSVSARLQELLG